MEEMSVSQIKKSRALYLTLSTVTLLFLGLIYAFSMFAAPMCQSFGLEKSAVGLTFNIMMILFCIGAVVGSQIEKAVGVKATIIIGAGAAGIAAAQTLRDFRPKDMITVLSIDEKVHSRCMLHKYLGHERDEQGINFVAADFFEKNDIYHIPCQTVSRIDTQAKTASLISIPRDTVVYYNGKYQKVNATYAGGEEAVADAVSDLLGVPVDFWMSINLKAFESIVNQIGGVYFTVPVDMDYEDPYQDLSIHVKAGYQLLNGKQAVGVMRCRSCYPSADIGRSATQRAFLTALVKQTVTLSNASKVTSLINTFSQYVSTSMPLNDMVYFGTQAIGMDLDNALNAAGLPGEWINPYWELDDEAVLELVNDLGIYKEEVPSQVLHIVHP